MNEKVFRVIKGYSKLNYLERKAIREQIENYETEDVEDRDELIKGIFESVGPINQDNCPCCGK